MDVEGVVAAGLTEGDLACHVAADVFVQRALVDVPFVVRVARHQLVGSAEEGDVPWCGQSLEASVGGTGRRRGKGRGQKRNGKGRDKESGAIRGHRWSIGSDRSFA